MMLLRYGDDDLLVGNETASALMALAALEAESTSAMSVTITALDNAGTAHEVAMLIGPATMMLTTASDSAFAEPDNAVFEAEVARLIDLHEHPATVGSEPAGANDTALDEL